MEQKGVFLLSPHPTRLDVQVFAFLTSILTSGCVSVIWYYHTYPEYRAFGGGRGGGGGGRGECFPLFTDTEVNGSFTMQLFTPPPSSL